MRRLFFIVILCFFLHGTYVLQGRREVSTGGVRMLSEREGRPVRQGVDCSVQAIEYVYDQAFSTPFIEVYWGEFVDLGYAENDVVEKLRAQRLPVLFNRL